LTKRLVSAPCSGFVMAGGHSRRMGRDKALLPWGGGTLLAHALQRLRSVCTDVAILSGAHPRYLDAGAPVLADAVPDRGPLGGLVAALEHARHDVAVILAVDLPFLPPELLGDLLGRAQGVDAVVPFVGGRPHPLCAVYRRSCAAAARRRLDAGDLKMTSFWPDVRVREVGEADLAAFGDPALLFRNLNDPQDYEHGRADPA
jgi:molybdopterin-guanine dinucleotide biosynthesis protein A